MVSKLINFTVENLDDLKRNAFSVNRYISHYFNKIINFTLIKIFVVKAKVKCFKISYVSIFFLINFKYESYAHKLLNFNAWLRHIKHVSKERPQFLKEKLISI